MFHHSGSYRIVYSDRSSASFQIPSHLREKNSLQLIWHKDDETQCVCPPVEEIVSCACNKESNNFITISGSYLTVSNLTEDVDYVLLHFMSSGLSGCNNKCEIRSVTEIYKIIMRGIQVSYSCYSCRSSQGFTFEGAMTNFTHHPLP